MPGLQDELRVPPRVEPALEAVAWTSGLNPRDYAERMVRQTQPAGAVTATIATPELTRTDRGCTTAATRLPRPSVWPERKAR